MSVPSFAVSRPTSRLPLLTLYLTERCNSRCVTCDYWRHGRVDLQLEDVRQMLPALERLGTRLVVLSGGEPLLHRQWAAIAELLKSRGFEVWLLTAGLALAKHAHRASDLFDAVTVSLDGADRSTYAAIRGLDAFETVCEGIHTVSSRVPVNLRVTLQHRNFRQLSALVELAKRLGARQVSFLAVDISNGHAFGRTDAPGMAGAPDAAAAAGAPGVAEAPGASGAPHEGGPALRRAELPEFERVIGEAERRHAEDFRSGFIAESPAKLRRMLQYFAAVLGQGAFPQVHCNAPEFSAVIDARGRMHPCFFIQGASGASTGAAALAELDVLPMTSLRRDIRAGRRAECKTCVCSMWRDLPS